MGVWTGRLPLNRENEHLGFVLGKFPNGSGGSQGEGENLKEDARVTLPAPQGDGTWTDVPGKRGTLLAIRSCSAPGPTGPHAVSPLPPSCVSRLTPSLWAESSSSCSWESQQAGWALLRPIPCLQPRGTGAPV